MKIKVECESTKRMTVEELSEFQGDLKTLSNKAYNKLRDSIKSYGFKFPLFVWKGKNKLLDGHQRLRVIKNENFEIEGGIPVIEIDAENEKEAAELVLLSSSAYGEETQEGLYEFTFKNNVDIQNWDLLELPRIDNQKFREAFFDGFAPDEQGEFNEDGEQLYTRTITAPTYEPKEETPPEINTLYDKTKTDELLEEIKQLASDGYLTKEVLEFLTLAAYRHITFDFSNIAEFYCHAPPEIQNVMENSALVLIDFDKAIKNGFVTLTKNFAKQLQNEYDVNDE